MVQLNKVSVWYYNYKVLKAQTQIWAVEQVHDWNNSLFSKYFTGYMYVSPSYKSIQEAVYS